MSEIQSSDVTNEHLVYLPVPEAFDADEDSTEYMTSVVADPIEHFIHHPERSLNEYDWTKDQLKKVNWPAIKIMWQNMLKDVSKHGEITGVILGKNGWGIEGEEDVRFIKFDFKLPTDADIYDPKRAIDPKSIKEDYLAFREDIISKSG